MGFWCSGSGGSDFDAEVMEKAPLHANTQVVIGNKEVSITWEAHSKAYKAYADKYGSSQSAFRIHQRGGFGRTELDMFYPDWGNHIT